MNIARLRGTRAFTLIELIVVIVIMGILVAIGAFAYNAVINHTHKAGLEKTAQQVAKSVRGDSAGNQTVIDPTAYSASAVTSLLATDLPSGVTLSGDAVSGLVVSDGTHSFTITCEQAVGGSCEVAPGTPVPSAAPVVTCQNNGDGTYTVAWTVENGVPGYHAYNKFLSDGSMGVDYYDADVSPNVRFGDWAVTDAPVMIVEQWDPGTNTVVPNSEVGRVDLRTDCS